VLENDETRQVKENIGQEENSKEQKHRENKLVESE
jgi:hypothetical protein